MKRPTKELVKTTKENRTKKIVVENMRKLVDRVISHIVDLLTLGRADIEIEEVDKDSFEIEVFMPGTGRSYLIHASVDRGLNPPINVQIFSINEKGFNEGEVASRAFMKVKEAPAGIARFFKNQI